MYPPPVLASAVPKDAEAAATVAAAAINAMMTTTAAIIGIDLPTPTDALATLATTTLAAAVSIATSSAVPSAPDDDDDMGGSGECRLLGPFALVVQLALGGLALLSLVYKRWRERPQRPVKVWFFDASKQVVGSLLVHVANVFMSMLTSGRFSIKLDPATVQTAQRLMRRDGDDGYTPNPCSFYLLNLAIDTTLGIPILIVLLRLCTVLVSYTRFGQPAESIRSGNYGSPPRAWWWFKQSIIYFCGLFGMKLCVLVIFLVFPWISRVGDWALGWTEGNERLQIVFVMMLFPLIMNALQYYIIDSYIKNQQVDHVPLPDEDPDTQARGRHSATYGQQRASLSAESLVSDEEEEARTKKPRRSGDEEYDPDVDGDAPTIIGSSSSRLPEQERVLRQGLYPKE